MKKAVKSILYIGSIILLLAIIIIMYLYYNPKPSAQIQVVNSTYHLDQINDGQPQLANYYFQSSAGYYEAMFNLTNVRDNTPYSIFVCTKNWSWVNQGSCYQFNTSEVRNNIQSHIYSAELSGCYVGSLQKTDC